MTNHVHVVGTGTIGGPLTHLLASHRADLGIDRVSFYKHTPRATDAPLLRALVHAGAELTTAPSSVPTFAELGFDAVAAPDVAPGASVIVEATPSGVALDGKPAYEAMEGPLGFLAQGSESGFGMPYALGVNDDVLASSTDRFVQVVSCNTHAISAILRALSVTPGVELASGRVVCIRRTTDVSQSGKGNMAPAISLHDSEFGTHHAEDVVRLYETTGLSLDLFSSAMKVPTQFMHTVWFDVELGRDVSSDEVEKWLRADPYLAVTDKTVANVVFNTGRELGYFGRIFNQAVVCLPSIQVAGDRVTGFAFTPQDGNVVLSNVAAVERFINPDDWLERTGSVGQYLFSEA